jgi:hypothetical protein
MPITAEFLKRFPNPVFIETGSFRGDGVQAALDAGCFDFIRTIEVLVHRAMEVKRRFNECLTWGDDAPARFLVYWGDSRDFLPISLREFEGRRATVFLDAHESTESIPDGKGNPLRAELEALQGTDHDILIDDAELLPLYKITLEEIQAMFPERILKVEPSGTGSDILILYRRA